MPILENAQFGLKPRRTKRDLNLSHATPGWVSWRPGAATRSNGHPILAVRKSGFAQEAAYLIALAQETFKRSSTIESC